ncbi:MAG: exo-alpha-sialidase [Geminicoccaceae bacterium]
MRCRISVDGGEHFSDSRRVGDFEGLFVRQPLAIGPDSEWLMPGFRCIASAGERWSGANDTAALLVSRDHGRSWQAEEIADSVGAVHMNIVEGRNDVRPAFFRDRAWPVSSGEAVFDGGLGWSAPTETNVPNNNSFSIQALRRRDGRIALVCNPVNASMSDQRRASLYDEIEAAARAAGRVLPMAPSGRSPRSSPCSIR